jgi:hypothetical protein
MMEEGWKRIQGKTGSKEACIETNKETKIERKPGGQENTKNEDRRKGRHGKKYKNDCGKKQKNNMVKDEGRK